MKAEAFVPLALRAGLAWFLFTITVGALYLVGTAQNFLASTQALLFAVLQGSSWWGMLSAWLVLVPLSLGRLRQGAAAVVLGVAFTVVVTFCLVWGSWVYPQGGGPW